MSEEQLKAFIAKANADQSIQDKLKAAKTPEDVVSIAKEHGHEFTPDKFAELSEEELEGVAGGGLANCGQEFGREKNWSPLSY
ncbi:nif11-like leader peptide domain protein [Synechococcus sp. BIOS-E4-1]|uniref:Nif11-like leader peptide family natural product precursor n=1 Tax=Synechococcus sp. BIOS-E4-1 TaxID=1400864 RepID=UPI0016464AFE|nr:Nif11-like leader peptide family natural product precursor [Synechococcus sp. BIOS-E4-1]QNI53428.1 nif11-like leader peptide domain protein [Synechococcus sp. BIOS-E4-1]